MESSTRLYHTHTPQNIQVELVEAKRDIVEECGCLIDTEVADEITNWMPSTSHNRGWFNQYMYIVDIY